MTRYATSKVVNVFNKPVGGEEELILGLGTLRRLYGGLLTLVV